MVTRSLIGENAASRLSLFTGEQHPRLLVTFGGKNLHRAPEEIEVENFIGVKSYKARGKRISTYEVGNLAWGVPYEIEGESQMVAMPETEDSAIETEA